MELLSSIAAIRTFSGSARGRGRRIALVPTMGYLHEGHASLIRAARAHAEVVVVSAFVNPLQFGPAEDFDLYPRDAQRDRAVAAEAGADALWTPAGDEMYPVAPEVTVNPGTVGTILEGAIRPGHFAGVLTVVLKLFGLVAPDVAVFGRKDAQQAFLVRRMVHDLNVPVTIVVAPSVREPDGLAMSSRNVYLGPAERQAASAIPRALAAGVALFRSGERRAGNVVAATWKALSAESALTVEYINVVDPDTFMPSHAATPRSYLVVAARAGKRRLIDNVVLSEGLEADRQIAAG